MFPSKEGGYSREAINRGTAIIPGVGGTLGISVWGCAAGTLEPLTYSRARSPEFCYPILELTPQIPPILEELFSRNY